MGNADVGRSRHSSTGRADSVAKGTSGLHWQCPPEFTHDGQLRYQKLAELIFRCAQNDKAE